MSLQTRLKPILRFFSEGKRLPTYLGIFATMFVLWLLSYAPPFVGDFIERLELVIYDQRLDIMPRAQRNPEHRIVIVDLDERSLQAEGQFPWNRIKVGRLVESLRDQGAIVVGFDVTFPEPDRSVRDLLEPVDLSKLDPSFSETLLEIEPMIDSDQYFANVMQSGIDVVLAINFNILEDVGYNELPPSIFDVTPELAERLSLRDMSGFTGNIPILQNAALGNGNMNQLPDADGVVRRVPLVLRYGNQLFPTLSLEMMRVYNFAEGYELITELYGDTEVVTAVSIGRGPGAFVIPTDRSASVLVPYMGPSSRRTNDYFEYISATDVLNNRVEEGVFTNALVLIGSSAPGIQDIRPTPLDGVYPGVEVHANMLHALLESVPVAQVSANEESTESLFANFQNTNQIQFPYKPDWEEGALFVIILALGLAMSISFPFMNAAIMAGTAIVLIIGTAWLNFQLWSGFKMDFAMVLVLLVILLVTVVNLIYGFLAESQTRKTIKGMFDQYVPPAHIDSMLVDPDNYTFEGESKELTVLFSDIRSFTTISEALSAGELKTLLNDFFTPITEIIFKHNGTIDKYVGDMVMAFWGAPLDDEQHRGNAVKAALEMLEKVEELKPEFESRGYPEVNIGCGINTGFMNVGDMGSTYRRSYTVLGDAVNLGSRLEGLTKFYGIRLLVGEETAKQLDGFLLRLIDKVKVKGKHKAVECYEPICYEASAGEQLKARVAEYHQALQFYHDQQWDEAESRLQTLLENEPECLLYKVYLERIETLRETPLPEDWDGAFTHTSK
ncbi:MAG: adenylate/guanylate cyclase domain-containing protein [Pseudomonadales bacterium]|nr:adenylate/guanylate cyclase domain-containing protein [Pseudomonadales bacterium]